MYLFTVTFIQTLCSYTIISLSAPNGTRDAEKIEGAFLCA